MVVFYLQQYILFCAIVLSCIGLGRLVLRPFSPRLNLSGFFAPLYFYGLAGLTLFITVYALYKSNGRTILGAGLLFIPFLILHYLRQPRKTEAVAVFPASVGGKAFLIKGLALVGLSLLIFTWETLAIAGNDAFFYRSVHSDSHFYGFIAKELREMGQENFFHIGNVFDAGYHGVTPYHYFELWAAAAASEITGTPEIPALHLVVYPLLGLLTGLGLWAFAEKQRLPHTGYVLLAFAFFAGGLYFDAFNGVRLLNDIKSFSAVSAAFSYPIGKKFLALFAFLPAVALASPSSFSFYVLLYLVVLSVAVLPSLAPAVGLYVLYLVYRRKVPRYWLYEFGVLIFLLGIYFLGFYSFFKPLALTPEVPPVPWPDSAALRTMRNIFVKITFEFALFQSPFLAVMVFIYKRIPKIDDASRILFGFYGFVFVLGLSAWAVAFRASESIQLFYAPACVLFSFLFLFVIIKYYQILLQNKWVLGALFCWTGLQTTRAWADLFATRSYPPKHHPRFLRAIEKANPKSELGVCFFSRSAYQTRGTKTFFPLPAEYATMSGRYAAPVHLSVHDMPIRDEKDAEQLKCSIFYRYCERLKQENRFTDLSTAQLSFVKTFNIAYAVTAQTDVGLPLLLRPLVRTSYHDPVSGDTVYYFR